MNAILWYTLEACMVGLLGLTVLMGVFEATDKGQR